MISADIEKFSFDKWYPLFMDVSVEAIVIPIPNDVLEYFRRGDLILPVEAVRSTATNGISTEQNYTIDWDSVDDSPELEQPTYPEFSTKLKDAMNSLGGEVFVKMNWNAPKDAAWITSNKSLKCTSLEDIYLVLKGSEMLSEDISYEFQNSLPSRSAAAGCHCVVMKRWTDMHPGSEFRCFVKNHELVAVSQRDCAAYYEHIEVNRFIILEDIVKFFKRKIMRKFPLPNYTFDITRNDCKITLIDFNPFDEHRTKPLLFKWAEIESKFCEDNGTESEVTNKPEFRFLGEDPGIQSNQCKHSGVPYEVEDLCSYVSNMSIIDYMIEESERQNSSGNVD
ncbi:translation initiation factor eIF2 assembly protein [Anabrus simplex]|uniref:translation initiation factor eIF2 assembly protein n=1 Tax=Anabrus simplex TaxID=316456 RepID=UPI0035A28140